MLANLPGTDGRINCVVAGASGGLGRAFLEAFAASPRIGTLHALSRRPVAGVGARWLACELEDEASIRDAAGKTGEVDCLVIATGLLHRGDTIRPEKDWRQLDPTAFARVLAVNTIGPAMLLKHFAERLPRNRPAMMLALSARVGSIADNHLGGWYAYRASKAALNQIIRTFAIELKRKRPHAVLAGLHPGTVDTNLSSPFGAAAPNLLTPGESVTRLLEVMENLGPERSGHVFDWKGERIPE